MSTSASATAANTMAAMAEPPMSASGAAAEARITNTVRMA